MRPGDPNFKGQRKFVLIYRGSRKRRVTEQRSVLHICQFALLVMSSNRDNISIVLGAIEIQLSCTYGIEDAPVSWKSSEWSRRLVGCVGVFSMKLEGAAVIWMNMKRGLFVEDTYKWNRRNHRRGLNFNTNLSLWYVRFSINKQTVTNISGDLLNLHESRAYCVCLFISETNRVSNVKRLIWSLKGCLLDLWHRCPSSRIMQTTHLIEQILATSNKPQI